MTHHLQEHTPDPATWGGYVVQLLGAGGLGFLLRELVKQSFGRAKDNDDNNTTKRGELRQQVADLVTRVDVIQGRLDVTNARANELFAENAELKAENRGLRERYHNLINWIAKQPTLPDPPSFLYERIEGPTEPKPPEQKP